jgi:hypothetical protein
MGIQTRGVPLAAGSPRHIADIEGADVPVGRSTSPSTATTYARTGPLPLGETRFPSTVDGRTVVLVDDVLYTGRTIRAALDAVHEFGRPAAIRLVVLVDRGHRELPIRADHVGKNLPTALAERRHGPPRRGRRRGRGRHDRGRRRGGRPVTAMRHLISIEDLDAEQHHPILDTAEQLKRDRRTAHQEGPDAARPVVCNLFLEDSTRTRISFDIAAKRLSADVINFSAKGSSVSKGESFKDTALTLAGHGRRRVVVRHSGVRRAAASSPATSTSRS